MTLLIKVNLYKNHKSLQATTETDKILQYIYVQQIITKSQIHVRNGGHGKHIQERKPDKDKIHNKYVFELDARNKIKLCNHYDILTFQNVQTVTFPK